MRREMRTRVQPLPDWVDLQSIGAEIMTYGEVDDPYMKQFNPSIAWDGSKLKIAIRSCNFGIKPDGHWHFRDGNAYSLTDVLYGDLDPDTLQVSNLVKLGISDDSPIHVKVSGLEDVRLFSRKDGMHAVGFKSDRVARSQHNKTAGMAEFIIKGKELKYIRSLEKPKREIDYPEKNWCPTDEPSKEFEFTYSPTQVWKDGKVTGLPYKDNIHGGTQLLKQKDGTYLSLVHEKILDGKHLRTAGVYDKHVYLHYLARHNKDGMIIELSKPFRFGTLENIEFAGGMVEHNGNLLISLGIRDCKYAIGRISKDKLMELFE